MRRILSLKLIITLCLNLIAPALQCGKTHYKLTHKKNYRHKEHKKNYKRMPHKQKYIYICKMGPKKQCNTQKKKKRTSFTPIKKQRKQKEKQPLNVSTSPLDIRIPTLNKLLFFLTFFIILTPALAECISGKHRFLIFDNDYDEAINKPPTKLLDEVVTCICIKGDDAQDVLLCNRLYGYGPKVCESGTKIGVIKGPISSGYYFKPMVVYIECDCYPDKSMLCFPTGVPDGLEQYGKLSTNSQTPTTLETVSQIASISTPVLLVGIGPICTISTCLAAALYCKYKKIKKKCLTNKESNKYKNISPRPESHNK